MARPRVADVARFREAPWFPPSGWYWSVEGGSSGLAKTKAKATERIERELARVGRFITDGQVT